MALTFFGPLSPEACLIGPVFDEEEKAFLRDKVAYFPGPVILLDGALNAFEEKPKRALAIGDGDSCELAKKDWIDVLLPVDKDQSDLAYALEHHFKDDFRYLEVHGLRGQRFDHELFNLGELHHFLTKKTQLLSHLGEGLWAMAKGEYQLELQGGFSLMSFSDCLVDLAGDVDYPLQKQKLAPLKSLGLSNRAFGKFQLSLDAPLFLYEIPDGHLEMK